MAATIANMIRRYWWVAGLLLAVLVVALLAPLASSSPDGLERVAIDAGFAEQGQDTGFGLLADYSVPFLGDSAVSLVVAGLLGVALLFAVAWWLGRALSRRSRPTD